MLIKRLEQQEALQKQPSPGDEEKKSPAADIPAPLKEKKWKQKFIKIWQYNDQLEGLSQQQLQE